MTRINAGIPVRKLSNKHLIAEHREIKRVPNAVAKKYRNGKEVRLDKIPNDFRLGKGHTTFFYNKLKYLYRRYLRIRQECIRRGFKVSDFSSAWSNIPEHLMNDWIPTPETRMLLEERIQRRLSGIKD